MKQYLKFNQHIQYTFGLSNDRRRVRALTGAIMGLLWLLCPLGNGWAGEPEASPSSKLIVRDVSVFLVSAHGKKLNDTALFRSTTPGYMQSRRLSADASESDKPAPLGLITFEGPATKDIDVLLEFPSGRFLAHWPSARIQSKRIYWRSQNLLKESPLSMQLSESHWLSPLQKADRLYVKGIDKCDRFILYDVELNHNPRITMTHAENGFQVQNADTYPLKDLTIMQPAGEKDHWKVAAIEQVPGIKKENKKPEAKSDQPEKAKPVDPLSEESLNKKKKEAQAKALQALGKQLQAAGALPKLAESATKPAEKKAAAAATASKAPAVLVPYIESAGLSQAETLEVWRKQLTDLGLGTPEVEHVLRILGEHALRSDQATVIYRLDESYLDKIMPLEITPFPDVVRRTGIVILLDADPALLKRIDGLIAQLGNQSWEKREAAQKKLEEYGKAAQAQLQKATSNKDLEIVFRAEQILGKIK
ncbi:hypothetical protein [Gimesia maris]|uniref:hypothetical protein n=1 Tax=Gimesia maris TaxID=122 RepID=UPI00241CE0F7|nr:hypothetical protein [Gimesia maris]|tara:strand:+ start:434824 stop:436254 length:1431 start_codon:yes stop_codon:yes gene_type:complete